MDSLPVLKIDRPAKSITYYDTEEKVAVCYFINSHELLALDDISLKAKFLADYWHMAGEHFEALYIDQYEFDI